MKSLPRLLALSLLTVAPTIAQTTVTDNFSSGSNWTLAAIQQGTCSLTISGGQVNYISTNSSGNAVRVLIWNAATYSYLTDWEAQVDVHARLVSLSSPNETINIDPTHQYYFYGSLVAFDTGDTGPATDSMSADIMRPGGGTQAFQSTYSFGGIRFEDPSNGSGIANNTTDAALRLAFNSTTKVLTTYYDADGGVGGYNWTAVTSIYIAGAENWSMTSGSTFTLGLEAVSGINAYGAGEVYFDNFSVTGIAAIPEPSTYAMLFGLAALGVAAYRRRRRQVG